jgi:hypothetical protein
VDQNHNPGILHPVEGFGQTYMCHKHPAGYLDVLHVDLLVLTPSSKEGECHLDWASGRP